MPKTIHIPAVEDIWDEDSETFLKGFDGITLVLEHSLLSISKWESIWEKPYISEEPKTEKEMLSYIECMSLKEIDPYCLNFLTNKNIEEINEYINKKMTATWFREKEEDKYKPKNKRIITSELIYCWMASQQIPFSCENWHFNRLMTLLRVCSEENKMPDQNKKPDLKSRKSLNAARRAKANSRG